MLSRLSAEEIYKECMDETYRYVRSAGFTDVVIGLSGGMDSSLVAAIAADAFGSEHVHGILMPGPYSSMSSIVDATELVDRLGIDAVTIGIEPAYSEVCKGFADAYDVPLKGIASENAQARCRMIYVMAASNAFGWMMLNTGNKSEAAMGYSTLYGDTAGAFAPIGGLYKTDVFELAGWRNRKAEASGQIPPIPQNVLEKPPSAELSPDQTDEGSLGVDYATLDRILVAHVERGCSDMDAETPNIDPDLIDRILQKHASMEYKRAMEPPFPRIAY